MIIIAKGNQLLWKICDAPAEGCGGGRRRAIHTAEDWCPACGSQLRVAKRQRKSPPVLR